MQFRNISQLTLDVGGVVFRPGQIGEVNATDPDTTEELEILLASGEFEIYVPAGQVQVNASLPGTRRRVWETQIPGGRTYNYYSATWDRGPNTIYGYAYFIWASSYSKTNPTWAAHGVSVPIKARLKRITHRFRCSTSAEAPVEVKVWKQKKIHNSTQVVNTLLYKTIHTTKTTANQILVWNPSDFGDHVIEQDEIIFTTYNRPTPGANTFWYMENLVFEFEEA